MLGAAVLAPGPSFALRNSPPADEARPPTSNAAGARGAGDGASHAQLQYASTTPSNASAAKLAKEAAFFKVERC